MAPAVGVAVGLRPARRHVGVPTTTVAAVGNDVAQAEF